MNNDPESKEAVFGIFTSEMDKLSMEVNSLSSAVYVQNTYSGCANMVVVGYCLRRLVVLGWAVH